MAEGNRDRAGQTVTWTADGLLRHTVYVGLREERMYGAKPRDAKQKWTKLNQPATSGADGYC